MDRKRFNIWWGPPRQFSPKLEERRISWLELFYDLVYVFVISATTHRLAEHPGWEGLGDYLYLFVMIFWGWVNGSLYHDLHGSPGIRTRFMTLWQMMAVAALAVSLNGPPETLILRVTIALAVMQAFITYLWWSVGIYDKHHRQLNRPYTICYLIALALMITALFIPSTYQRIVYTITLVLNFLPPFLLDRSLKKGNEDFSLSTSMMERLGLLTIIVFGEVILGVINGTSKVYVVTTSIWINFGLGILIVFGMWWIFFALVADRVNNQGFLKGQILLMLFIPTLSSLGMTGASFPGVIHSMFSVDHVTFDISRIFFGAGVAGFLWCITMISLFLEYPREYDQSKRILRPMLIISGLVILLISSVFQSLSVMWFLSSVFIILFLIIFVITRGWFVVQLQMMEEG